MTPTIRYGDHEIEMTEEGRAIVAGRNRQCEIVIQQSTASRLHARFEHRRGKIVVVDLSTNGTYVQPADGAQIFLHREECVLGGEGVISFGVPVAKANEHLLHYKCE